jgi:NAD(P)-dependent dehydrogenase (short-subunit alcohol dehydrogenase family)
MKIKKYIFNHAVKIFLWFLGFWVLAKALSYYTSNKYAMLRLAKLLASDYVDKDIYVNPISPSMIDTNFLNNMKKFSN